jgi:serine/threonine-protein kinase
MDRIGRYEVLTELGRGAMGVVYQARDPAIGRTVAIKTIRLSDFADPNERERMKERLMREAQSAGVLSHPSIVTIFDFFQEGDTAFVVMEFVNGPTLDRLLATEELPPEGILNIFRQTAAALDYAHKKGIVHRDIKPSNLMIHEDGVPKITDFGVAKISSHHMTQAGSILGTPNYMSPEQVQGQTVDGRADQFALAVIAYEVLTGEKPFVGDAMPTVLFKIVKESPMPAQHVNPSLGLKIDSVIAKALSKDPDDRFPSVCDFVNALTRACDQTPGWKPMRQGAMLSMPTVARTGAMSEAVPRPSTARRRRHQEDDDEAPETPARRGIIGPLLGFAAGIAIVVLLVAGVQAWLAKQRAEEAQLQPRTEGAADPQPADRRPSPTETPSAGAPLAQEEEDAPTETDAQGREKQAAAVKPDPVRPRSSAAERMVTVNTVPPGATVVFDNNPSLTCRAPCTLPLLGGRHTLTAEMEGFRRLLRIFEVSEDTNLWLELERRTGKLSIRTNPPGATIYINGQQRPEKTPALLTLPAGRYQVAVALEGRSREEEEVELRDDALRNITIDWENR